VKAIFVLLLFAFAQSGWSEAGPACSGPPSARIIRIDDAQKRVFVNTTLRQINSAERAKKIIRSLESSIRECRPTWGQLWSASFFTDPRFAGYKDEPKLQAYVVRGEWSNAYVGEYDRSSKTLTVMPASGHARRLAVTP
jgi:hypothetical protein